MSKLTIYSPAILSANIILREGEEKLGEKVQVISDLKELKKSTAKYVFLGIPEDIGVRANFGVAGTASLWKAALKVILNLQENSFLSGKDILLLGHIEVDAMEGASVEALRKAVEELDKTVSGVIQKIVAAGKIPIIIGGGHNNAYGNLKGASAALKKPINVINVDAHADLRPLEGRHSGNGFSYALHEGYLNKYYMLGLHESYASAHILEQIAGNSTIKASFFEELFVTDKQRFSDAKNQAIAFVKDAPCGLEIDLDSLQGVLSSAITPSGLSTNQVRQFVHQAASQIEIAYLHVCEGAVELADGRNDNSTAKLVAYLVTDFIKAHQKR